MPDGDAEIQPICTPECSNFLMPSISPLVFPHTPNESAVLTITALIRGSRYVPLYTNYAGTVMYPNIFRKIERLNEIGDVHWHLLDLSAVELLDLSHHADILGGNKVDGNTLSSKTTSTTDSVDVVLTVGWKIVVDDQRDLLDINTTGQKIGGNQNTGRTRSELLHNQITLTLVHISVHGRDSEVAGSELVGEPINLSSGIAEDNGLCDGDGFVQIRKGVQLPILLLNSNIKLLDTFEGEFGLLDQDTDRVAHELGGDLKNILGHGGGQKNDLSGLWQELENVVDLFSETALRYMSVKAQKGSIVSGYSQKASHRPHREQTSSCCRSSRIDAGSCHGHDQVYRQRLEDPPSGRSYHHGRWYHQCRRGIQRS